MLVFRLISQPFDAELSQLPYPGLHVIAQAPDTQEATPPVPLHTFPQAPQLVTLVLELISQPSEYEALQFL